MTDLTDLLPRIALGFALSIVVGGVAWWRGSLTASGWLGAVLTGTLTFGFGGWSWGLALITFFVSSSLLSHYKEQIKKKRVGEKFSKGGQRDLAQALANGGLGALLAVAYALLGEPPVVLAFFVGVMATVTADTWATELGVLSPAPPRLITTLRPVEPGTSGGITLAGTAASASGGLIIGVAMWVFLRIEQAFAAPLSSAPLAWLIPAALLGGLLGSLTDSLIGATCQALYAAPDGSETERTTRNDGTPNPLIRGWRWLNNDLVNAISTLAGGSIAAIVFWLVGPSG